MRPQKATLTLVFSLSTENVSVFKTSLYGPIALGAYNRWGLICWILRYVISIGSRKEVTLELIKKKNEKVERQGVKPGCQGDHEQM